MKQRVFIGAMLILAVASVASLSAEERDYNKFDEALGFQWGEISGSGLSYQRWMDRIGYQFAFGAWYFPLDEDYGGSILDYSIGGEFQYSVYGEDFAKWLSGQLYLFAGLTHQGYIEGVDSNEDLVYETGPFGWVLGGGVGIGIEVILFEHFSIPFEIGYGVYWDGSKDTLPEQFKVDLIPQIGFRYRY